MNLIFFFIFGIYVFCERQSFILIGVLVFEFSQLDLVVNSVMYYYISFIEEYMDVFIYIVIDGINEVVYL